MGPTKGGAGWLEERAVVGSLAQAPSPHSEASTATVTAAANSPARKRTAGTEAGGGAAAAGRDQIVGGEHRHNSFCIAWNDGMV